MNKFSFLVLSTVLLGYAALHPAAQSITKLSFWNKLCCFVGLSTKEVTNFCKSSSPAEEQEIKEASYQTLSRKNSLKALLYDTCSSLPLDLIMLILSYDQYILEQGSPVYALADLGHNKIASAGRAICTWDLGCDQSNPQRCSRKISIQPALITALAVSKTGKLIAGTSVNQYAVHKILCSEEDPSHCVTRTLVLGNKKVPTGLCNEALMVWNQDLSSCVRIEPQAQNLHVFTSQHPPQKLPSYQRSWDIEVSKHISDRAELIGLQQAPFLLDSPISGACSVIWKDDKKGHAFGCENGCLILFDMTEMSGKKILQAHATPIRALASISDGLCASGSDDGVIKIWSIQTGMNIATISDHVHAIRALLFLPEKKCLVSGSDDGTIIIHPLDFVTSHD